jgi:predicted GNAT family acetyltransferase
MDDPQVTDHPELRRFEARSRGELAGVVTYDIGDEKMVLIHTEVEQAFEGKGVGGRLARAALESARERGLRVVPRCPFVAVYLKRHPEFGDLVDEEDRSRYLT